MNDPILSFDCKRPDTPWSWAKTDGRQANTRQLTVGVDRMAYDS